MAFAVLSLSVVWDLSRKGCHSCALHPSNVSCWHYRLYWLCWALQPISFPIINHNCVCTGKEIHDKGPEIERKKFQMIDRCEAIALCIDNIHNLASGWTIKDSTQTIMSSLISPPSASLLTWTVWMKWDSEQLFSVAPTMSSLVQETLCLIWF